MRAIVYVRVSSSDQVQGFSLDVQEKVCRDFADRHGWTVGLVAREEGESAKTTDRRELQRVLGVLSKPRHGYSCFLVYDLTRFTRDTGDYLSLKARLAAAGVRLVAVTQPIEDSPTGRFLGTVLAAQGQLDNEIKRERTTAGMKEAIRRGIWPWQPPVGHCSVRGADGRARLEHDDRAPLVRRAFERIASGAVSLEEARAELGIRIPRETFSRLIHHPLYCGRIVAPRWGMESRLAGEPIVSEELWHRAQLAMAGIPQGWRRSEIRPEFPLRWWTRCAVCRTGLTGYFGRGTGGAYPYYRCPAGKQHQNVPRAAVHAAFGRLLDSLACPPGLWRLWEAVLTQAWEARAKARASDEEGAERRLRALDAREEKLVAGYLAGDVDGALLKGQRARIAAERAGVQVPRPLVALKPALEAGRRIVQDPRGTWETLAPVARPAFVRIAFPDRLDYEPKSGFQTPVKSLYLNRLNAVADPSRDEWYPEWGDPDALIAGWTAAASLLEEPCPFHLLQ